MNDETLNRVASRLIKQRRYKQWQITVSILASIVVFVTIYLLILPAITEETKLYCGHEEHIHTDECYSCYAEYIKMGIVPPACNHTSCELICEKEEHEHTEMCYINCHTVLITMTYKNPNTLDEDAEAENNGADSEIKWERHITVKDRDSLLKYLDDIATLPNGLEAKNAVWYNAADNKEYSITDPVLQDLELYADFNEQPKKETGETLVFRTDKAKLGKSSYSSWDSIKNAINSGETEITLTCDISAPAGETLEISGKNITIDLNGFTLNLTNPLQVIGWSILNIKGKGTIRGNNLDELILVKSSTLNLSDATLTNTGGHGVHIQDWASLNMYSGSVSDCGAAGINGGGILAENGSSVNISGGSVSDNNAQNGGGIYVSGNSAVNMTGGTISRNSALCGGGVYVSGGISTFSGGTVTGNSSTKKGGGIYAGSWSKADIKGNISISENRAGTHGGGVYADNTVNSDPRIAISGQAVVMGNTLISTNHTSDECVLQNGLKSCKNVAAAAENLLSVTDDAYVEGIVNMDGLSGLIAEADGRLTLESNQNSDARIVIDTDLIIDLNGYNIEYTGSGNGSTLFDVSPGVTLTVIDSSETKSGTIIGSSAEALITVEENALLNIQGGTLNNAEGQHVILINGKGTANMSDGIITGASTGEWGGGICAVDGAVYISGGKITNNTVSVGGGGVCARYFNMSGGEISNNNVIGNNARGGGGVNLKKDSHTEDSLGEGTSFNGIITGGKIINNSSDHVGGGLFVSVGSEVYVKGTTGTVYIENNKALDKKYKYGDASSAGHGFGGGGIFVEHPDDSKGGYAKNGGLLYIYNAVVTENTAKFGGGIAGCGSSSVEVYSNDGVAVFGNRITGVGDNGANTAMANSIDLYCDGKGKVDSMLLGDIQSGWSGRTGENGREEISFREGAITLNNFYLKADELSAADKTTINSNATVFIRGNTSGSGGGGIGGNGFIKLGLAAPTGTLIIEKKVADANEAGDWTFDFTLTINGKTQIVTLTKEKPSVTFDNLPIGTTYSVKEKEVSGYTLVSSSNTEGTINGNIATVSFVNAVLYTLPSTGGFGSGIYQITGISILSLAGIYLLHLKKESLKYI